MVSDKNIEQIAKEVLVGSLITRPQAEFLTRQAKDSPWDIFHWANKIREKFFADKVKVCSIVPGRLGGCNQDCKFCAQSAEYDTAITETKTLTDAEILKAAKQAKDDGIKSFGIVYSGRAITEKELARLEKLIPAIKQKYGMVICASLGIINAEQAARLAKAGLDRYNHNLETSKKHFPSIVSTHKYIDRVKTIKSAQAAGLGICAGGIFGIGETDTDRIEMAFALRQFNIDTVPMNFLHPIDGTPLAKNPTLQPLEILRIIALYRFILPGTHLKIAGGRVLNLRDMQSWIFYAGATSILSGNYLTTAGRAVEQDLQMITDLGLQPEIQ